MIILFSEVSRDFDLAFTKEFSNQATWLKSAQGFELVEGSDLSLVAYVINLGGETSQPGILSLSR